jgi:hypothetical protein
VGDHPGRVLGDQGQVGYELLRRPNALDERRDLVGVFGERRSDDRRDRGMIRIALGTDDHTLGQGWRW